MVILELEVLITLCIAAGALAMIWRSPSVSPALAGLMTFYFVLWHVLPVCLSLALWDQLTLHIVPVADFLRIAAIETGAFAAIALCFPLWRSPSAILQRCSLYSFRASTLAIFCVAIAAAAISAYSYFSTDFGSTYQERNAFAVTAAGTEAFNRKGSVAFLSELMMAVVLAALVTGKNLRIPKWLTAFLAVVTAGWMYMEVAEGSRMAMLMPIVLFILYTAINRWSSRRIWTTVLIVGPGLAALVGLVTIAVQFTRSDESNSIGSNEQIIDMAVSAPGSVSRLGTLIGNALVFKLDSFSTGAVLLESSGAGDAGLAPYAGAVMAAVPRVIYEDKPVPGSSNGKYDGRPDRMVAFLLGMDPDSGNVGVGIASVAIWQLGFPGLILLVAACAINLWVVNTFLLAPSVLGRATALLIIVPPSLTGLLATPDAILMSLQRLVLIVALFGFAVWALDKRAWIAGTLHDQLFPAKPESA